MTLKNSAPFLAPLCALALAATLAPAEAATVTYQYTAVGSSSSPYTAGATVTGSFGFDLAAPDIEASAGQGVYAGAGFLTIAVSGGVQDGLVQNLSGLNWIVIDGSAPGSPDGLFSSGAGSELLLSNSDGTAFDSDALPGTLDLADFTAMRYVRVFGPDNLADYQVTSIWLATPGAAVPAPATGSLLAAAALAMLWLRPGRRSPALA